MRDKWRELQRLVGEQRPSAEVFALMDEIQEDRRKQLVIVVLTALKALGTGTEPDKLAEIVLYHAPELEELWEQMKGAVRRHQDFHGKAQRALQEVQELWGDYTP